MKRIVVAVVILWFMVSVCEADDRYTEGKINGRMWTQTSELLDKTTAFLIKYWYLNGFVEGVAKGESMSKWLDRGIGSWQPGQTIPPEERPWGVLMTSFGLRDMITCLDNSYSDPANRVIPVSFLVALHAARMKGQLSDDTFSKALQEARREYQP
jgi:hypothetical protein